MHPRQRTRFGAAFIALWLVCNLAAASHAQEAAKSTTPPPRDAPANATIVTETPGVVRYYAEKFGRQDLQSKVLSDPNFDVPSQGAVYFILQRGRTYFENRDKMNHVREHFPMVYASCVREFTAAEVYSAQAGAVPANERCSHPQYPK